MPSKTAVLAFDTSAAYCAAALLLDGKIVASTVEEMNRGQGENLMPILETLLAENSVTWGNLTAIGVGIGPGNFTGIRISVAAARGLALALDIPAIGVSTFDATSLDHTAGHVSIVTAPRDQVYAALPDQKAALISLNEAKKLDIPLVYPPTPQVLVQNIALICAKSSGTELPPAPLYIRAADAAPSRDKPPTILYDDT